MILKWRGAKYNHPQYSKNIIINSSRGLKGKLGDDICILLYGYDHTLM